MERFKCGYCGREYDTIPERTNCENDCAERIKAQESQIAYERREEEFVNRVEDLKKIYSDAESMIKYAESLEKELREDYPEKKIIIDRNFPNKNNRNNENYITVDFDKDCNFEDLYRKIEKQLKIPVRYWNFM